MVHRAINLGWVLLGVRVPAGPPRQAEPHGLCTSAVLFARCSLAINLPNLPVERGSGGPMGGDAGKSCSRFVLLPPPQPLPTLLSPGCLKGKIMMARH